MVAFEVSDMTCGLSVSTITRALNAADQDARVRIDLAMHRVQVDPGPAGALVPARAIEDVGDTLVPVETVAGATTAQQHGGCCGRCR